MNTVLYYVLQFVIGGVMVVGITVLAKYFHPKYTGIVYALPAIIIVALIFIYLNQGLHTSRLTLKSTLIYEFTLIFFILTLYLLLYKINFWLALLIAFISWSIIVVIIQFFINK